MDSNRNSPESLLHKDLTEIIIKVYYDVYNELGYGFLEKVYQNAMVMELEERGFKVEAQKKILVHYRETVVGEYYADILVNDTIILELKSCELLVPEHEAQLLNYLRATEFEVGLLFNFGKKVAFRRKIYTNDQKKLNITD
ncbi:MAG: GxxExxY protein [Bacteroidota bacterium]